jgi:L-threonylcarbamoyladenylate synthase
MSNVDLFQDAAAALATLRAGGVLLAPTDTVLGLIALPSNAAAVERIFALKARPAETPLPIFVPNAAAAESLGLDVNDVARRLLDGTRGRATCTTVMGFRAGPRAPWLAGRDEAAVRVPNDPLLLEILDKTGPLVSTSANRHGAATPETTAAAAAELAGSPDLVLPGRERSTEPSTIVNCRHTPPTIQRIGAHAELVKSLMQGPE